MEEVAARVEEFIEQVYNPVRLHSALAYQSPVEFEQQQALEKTKAWVPAKMSFPRQLNYTTVSKKGAVQSSRSHRAHDAKRRPRNPGSTLKTINYKLITCWSVHSPKTVIVTTTFRGEGQSTCRWNSTPPASPPGSPCGPMFVT